ncbi:hypothetical protein GCM10007320_09140 [Pseudorhodoferax aquiterrae]|uniref:HNH endonuclease n=1 Tax=Pseudorhodoferax aquiterrae TaxID=747304 RepID=A0ABQ3FXU8_9BURK|nr:HNH endonuclease [Pseudorhodoferax aquiterrae]GHC72919.1 hypothetical protein GCM10007320_09140 [Pseudorhodoferax aquiterrae]
MTARKFWTERELRLLRDLYPDLLAETVARQIGRTTKAVQLKARELGIRKSAAFMDAERARQCERARTHPNCIAARLTSSTAGWNRGVKGSTGTSATRFVPGNKPQTWRPVGSESYNKEGLLIRKVSDTGNRRVDWRRVDELDWEAVHGPIPAGHFLVRQSAAGRGLVLLNRAELMKRNSVHANYPPEIARLSQLRGALTRQINSRTRALEQP